MATKQLKTLLENDPNLLKDNQPPVDNAVRHFIFTTVDAADPMTVPVCGDIIATHIKHRINAVDCAECLAALEVYANVDKYDQALVHATALVPKILRPDPEIMKKKHGTTGQSIEAIRHIKAKRLLDSKAATSPEDLAKRSIGAQLPTFYKNMIEVGLIKLDGERTGLSAQDLADGNLPPETDKITED